MYLFQELEKEKKPKESRVRVTKVKGGNTSEPKKTEYESGHCQQDAIKNAHTVSQDTKLVISEPPNPATPSTNSNGVKDSLHAGGSMMMPPINLTGNNLMASNHNSNPSHSNAR